MSAGRLSPLQNLSVTFLDFRGKVNWSPGIGNPPGTTYTVEMQLIGEEWSRLETCTNIEFTSCPLIFNLNDLLGSYCIRVKASWRGNNSRWIRTDTFQPYGNTLLSPPTLNVSIQESDIYVHVHMPQVVLSVLPKLKYSVQVYENNSGDHEEVNFTMHVNKLMRSQQTEPHPSSETCVKLPDNTSDILKHVAMATILLLLVIIALIITFMYIYMKPRVSDLYTPSSLEGVVGAGRALMAIPPEAPYLLASLCVITTFFRSGMTLEYQSSCNWGYECRVSLSCPDQTADLPPPPPDEEELEKQHFLSPCLYSGALDEDGQGSRISEGETHNAQLLFEERDRQLDQGFPCLDVPMSSLSLCLNSGEPWDSCGEGDSVGEEEAEMDLGTKLLVQSWRNSAGDLFGALETIDELCPLNKSHLPGTGPAYATGYEPHPNPTNYEPISSACSPSHF
ncbi:hypothetical protein SKAU_G00261300 [Synaphobranchus kaupii]|uniref:Fibronectin type-III domain-containing protein n=1 Tax=Synaphobranchus kaupii TaxID=118154 RepID=A0A9Q1EYJ2_SYNKA|nr:hypothetical protein SKAU_G00261300 [Synaphobranchus kaupii]